MLDSGGGEGIWEFATQMVKFFQKKKKIPRQRSHFGQKIISQKFQKKKKKKDCEISCSEVEKPLEIGPDLREFRGGGGETNKKTNKNKNKKKPVKAVVFWVREICSYG